MLYELARIYDLQKEPNQAEEFLSQATAIANGCSDKKLKDACHTLQSNLGKISEVALEINPDMFH